MARRLPVTLSCGILAGMHKPIGAGVLSIVLILLITAIPWSGAHAAMGGASAPPKGVGYKYTVQPTDTLWGIAAAHGITVDALIAANKLADPRLLRPGQTLWVPALPPASAAPNAKTISPESELGEAGGASAVVPPPGKESWPPELLSLINTSRGAAGLPLLTWSPELAQAAQAHAADCAHRNQGSHLGSDGARLEDRILRQGVVVRRASENWANAQSVQHAFGLWWNEPPGSDPHRRNILDPKYTKIGIGVADGKWGAFFVADFAGP